MPEYDPSSTESSADPPSQPMHQSAPPLSDSLQRASYVFPPTDPYASQTGPLGPPTQPDGVPTLHRVTRRRSPWIMIAMVQSVILIGLFIFFLARPFANGNPRALATHPPSTVIIGDGATVLPTSISTDSTATPVNESESTPSPAHPATAIPTNRPTTPVPNATTTTIPQATATTAPPAPTATATPRPPTPTPTPPPTSATCKNSPSYYHCNNVDPTTGSPNCISPAYDRADATIGSGVIHLWYNTTCLSAWTQTTGDQPMSQVKIQAVQGHNASYCNANSGTCDSQAYTLIDNAGGLVNWYTNLVYSPPGSAAARSCAKANGSSTWVCTSWYTG